MATQQPIRAQITLTDAADRFDLLLPHKGTPDNIHAILKLLLEVSQKARIFRGISTGATSEIYGPSELATGFILAASQAGIRLVGLSAQVPVTDYQYRITCPRGAEWNIAVANGPRTLFSGTVAELGEWLEQKEEQDEILKKIVQFKYNGGTKPGALRTVRVEHVDDNYLEGFDLEKEDLVNDGYRKYDQSKIVGNIYILTQPANVQEEQAHGTNETHRHAG